MLPPLVLGCLLIGGSLIASAWIEGSQLPRQVLVLSLLCSVAALLGLLPVRPFLASGVEGVIPAVLSGILIRTPVVIGGVVALVHGGWWPASQVGPLAATLYAAFLIADVIAVTGLLKALNSDSDPLSAEPTS